MKILVVLLGGVFGVVTAAADFTTEHLSRATAEAIGFSQNQIVSKQEITIKNLNLRLGKHNYPEAQFFEQFADYIFTIKFGLGERIFNCQTTVEILWDKVKERSPDEKIFEEQGDYQLVLRRWGRCLAEQQ